MHVSQKLQFYMPKTNEQIMTRRTSMHGQLLRATCSGNAVVLPGQIPPRSINDQPGQKGLEVGDLLVEACVGAFELGVLGSGVCRFKVCILHRAAG